MGDRRAWMATSAAVSLYILGFGYLVVRKSQILQNADDFPQYLQALWSILHDRPFATSWREVGGAGGSLLGMHLELTLGLFAPLHALAPDPAVLLVVQVVVVALAAIPIAVCATRLLGNPLYGFAFAVAHLANPYLQRALFYDFHPESLQFLAVTSAAAFLLRERYRWFVVAAVLAVLSKEDSGVHLFVLGAYAWLAQGKRSFGLVTMAASLASVGIGSGVLVPWFRGDSAGYPVFARKFPALGDDIPTIVTTLVLDPVKVAGIVWDPVNFHTLSWALLPFAFLPLVPWRPLLLVAPALALVSLTQFERLKTLSILYGFSVLPLFPFAAMVGLRDLSQGAGERWRSRVRLGGSLAVAGLSLSAMVAYGPTPVRDRDVYQRYYINRFPLAAGFSLEYFRDNRHARTGRAFMRDRVPAGASLGVEYRLASHVVNRRVLRPLSETPTEDWLLFDLYGPPYAESPRLFHRLLNSPDYGVVAFEDGYTLMGRGASRHDNARVRDLFSSRFEAEDLRSTTGSIVPDHREASRMARHARAGVDPTGLLSRGQSQTLDPGAYVAAFALRRGPQAADGASPVAVIEIIDATTRASLARHAVDARDLDVSGTYRMVRVPLRLAGRGRVELRVSFTSAADLWLDRVEIEKSPAAAGSSGPSVVD